VKALPDSNHELALTTMRYAGCCVSIFYKPIVDILYILTFLYDNVSIIKPTSCNIISFEKFCEYYDIIFKNSEIFVARLNDKIVGSITIIYDQKFINNYALYAHIEDVVVDEDYRTLKIGSKLIEHVKNRCIEKNCRKCSLVCSKEISSFYLKNHFEEKGIHMTFIPLNT
jgi:GNAT superfamily N-acetyltransferase